MCAGPPLLVEVGTAGGSAGRTPPPLGSLLVTHWGSPGPSGLAGPLLVPFLGSEQDWSHIPVHPPGTKAHHNAPFPGTGGDPLG